MIWVLVDDVLVYVCCIVGLGVVVVGIGGGVGGKVFVGVQ